MNSRRSMCVLLSLLSFSSSALADDVRVCVDVGFGSLKDVDGSSGAATEPPKEATETKAELPPAEPQPPGPVEPKVIPRTTPGPAKPVDPNAGYPLPPRAFLRRMIEHYIQHEPGFVSVSEKCDQKLSVELYRTSVGGWTVFGRYSGFQSEEKVDRVEFSEFPKLARRLTAALLYDRRIESTVTRTSVLEADSAGEQKTVRGTHMFQLAVGSTFRFPVGGLPTAISGSPDAAVENRFRLVNPVDLQLGYRGDFRHWAVDAYMRIGIGVSFTDSRNNTLGGHIDHIADFELGMNFLWHMAPDDVWSFYMGPGARFELTAFDVVEPESRGDDDDLIGAGLTVVGVFGVEFLRTTSVRPFAQLELSLPAYLVDTETRHGSIHAWLPGASVVLGALF